MEDIPEYNEETNQPLVQQENQQQEQEENKQYEDADININNINEENIQNFIEKKFQRILNINDTLQKSILHNKFGSFCFQGKGFLKAEYDYVQAIKLAKKAGNFSISNSYMNLGNCYGQMKDYEKAIKAYKKAIEFSPYNQNPEKKKQFKLIEWNKRLNSFDAFVDAHINLGVLMSNNQQQEEAFEYIKKAIELQPTNKEAIINFGDILRQIGKRQEAIDFTWNVIKQEIEENWKQEKIDEIYHLHELKIYEEKKQNKKKQEQNEQQTLEKPKQKQENEQNNENEENDGNNYKELDQTHFDQAHQIKTNKHLKEQIENTAFPKFSIPAKINIQQQNQQLQLKSQNKNKQNQQQQQQEEKQQQQEQQEQKQINIVCVKWGTRYGYEYVNKLYRGIKRNTTLKFKFFCFTDDKEGLEPEITAKPLKEEWKRWWGKASLFAEDKDIEGSVFYIDLDMIVTGNIDEILQYQSAFAILKTDQFACEQLNKGGYNSSIMIWDSSIMKPVYQVLKDNYDAITKYLNRFDFWLEMMIENAEFLNDKFTNNIADYLNDCKDKQQLSDQTKIVCFPRTPKPEDCHEQWVYEHWF
ncbi:hypothetical protein PPERSA_00377 [Pseudocohnilembus persalinus]|uniref:Uncharacterized protein n=1 Tax=Pseudocohnilembus persalinus TaxID=266149 RepID=A0A0V0QYD1_PSEPJ|nr:hypothetical protein PPERSA_00377 [Pseudocohnilembus persalinus]|eukprot:KRX07220.1 hypothetical protein PPERSA_00377 [Pseudocohnilembus persalinus]